MSDPGSLTAEELEALVRPDVQADERAAESALRPHDLADFQGQPRVSEQLGLLLDRRPAAWLGARPRAAVRTSRASGKTTLAMIIAAEMAAPLRISSGPAIQHAGDLAAILSGLSEGEVFFLDEIHRMSRPAEEMLYLAMEDFRVDVVVGKGPGATAIPLEIPRFTLVGATTRAGLLPGPLRDRFGFTAQLDFYDAADLEHIVRRSAGVLGADLSDDGAAEIARRSRGTPRIANRLLRRVRDFAQVRADGKITLDLAHAALDLYEVDAHRPGPAGPRRADCPVQPVRRRTGRAVHPGHLGRRGERDRRGGRRAVPGAGGVPDAYAPWPGCHPRRLGAPRSGPTRRHHSGRRTRHLLGDEPEHQLDRDARHHHRDGDIEHPPGAGPGEHRREQPGAEAEGGEPGQAGDRGAHREQPGVA